MSSEICLTPWHSDYNRNEKGGNYLLFSYPLPPTPFSFTSFLPLLFFSFPSLFSLFLFLFHLPFHPQSAPDLTSNSSLHSMFEFSTPHFFRTSFHLTCLAYSLQLPALLLIFLHPPISPFSLLPNMLSQSSFPSPRHIFLTNKLLQFFLPPIYPHPLNLFPLRSPPFIYFRVFYISCFLFSLCSILIRAL